MSDKSVKCTDITVIILALNEELHIDRCIRSVSDFATRIIVVDSGSTDRTTEIAKQLGAEVIFHPFFNYAKQFNWALDNSSISTAWIMRLDADEYVTPELATSLAIHIEDAPPTVQGFTLNLRRVFMGRWLRWGGLYPITLLRVWRYGCGRCEDRWMDEHVSVSGEVRAIREDFVDHNLNSLTWWTDKHNRYASREAVDLLNVEFQFLQSTSIAKLGANQRAGVKRWIKEEVYARLPGGLRALAYFLYRYVLRLGFLDGRAGATFHVLQAFWYRYLVDVKIAEVKRHMSEHQVSIQSAIQTVLQIRV